MANRLPVARDDIVSPILRRFAPETAGLYCYVAANQWIVAHLGGDAKPFFHASISDCPGTVAHQDCGTVLHRPELKSKLTRRE